MDFSELLMVALVALLVIGPKQLPEAMRTLGLWFGRLQRSFNSVKEEISKEIGMDEIRRQLHNEAVMEEMKRIEREVKNSVPDDLDKDIAPPPATDELPARMTPEEPAAEDRSAEPETSEAAPIPEPEPPEPEPPEPEPPEPEPAPPTPRSEAELEAYHEAKAKQAARDKQEGSA